MNEAIRFVQSVRSSELFSTNQLRRLDELVQQLGEIELQELAAAFTAAYPGLAATIDFVQSATATGYDILGEIGRGGMAIIFRVVNRHAGNRVEVLKLLQSGVFSERDEEMADRFQREIRYLREVDSPHLVHVYEDNRTNRDSLYFTMELLHGATLRDWVARNGPVPVDTALEYLRQIAEGLAALHARNIVHRDVKPSNVFIEDPGNHVVLLDLGIARRTAGLNCSEKITASLTRRYDNLTVGTLAYSSSRQLTNPSQVDASDDVYSLGCLFYYLLTGEHAFGAEATNVAAAALAHNRPRPKRPSLLGIQQLRRVWPEEQLDVLHEVDNFFQTMIDPEPTMRYRDARVLAGALSNLVGRLDSVSGLGRKWIDRAGALSNLVGQLDAHLPEQINNSIRREIRDRQLLPDYGDALAAYLKHLREQQLAYSPIPLVRAGTQTMLNIKDVFVNIAVRNKESKLVRANLEKASDPPKPTPASKPDLAKDLLSKLFPSKQQPTKGRDAGDPGPERGLESGTASGMQRFNADGFPGGTSELGALLFSKRKLVLLGPPGGGKTTLLKRAALAFAEARCKDLPGWPSASGMVPVFLRLRNFAAYLQATPLGRGDVPRIIEYLGHYYRDEQKIQLPRDFFDRFLETEGCAVFMDGLDEVPESLREDVARHVDAFVCRYESAQTEKVSLAAEAYPERKRDNLFVMASRPKGYDAIANWLPAERFAVCEVKSLDKSSIRQLLTNVLRIIEPNVQKRDIDLAGLIKAIEGSRELTILAGTPLFSTSLILVYMYRGAELPKRRVDVFDEIVDLLLGFWKAEDRKPIPGVPTEEEGIGAGSDLNTEVSIRKKRLSHIALEMQLSDNRTEIHYERLVGILIAFLLDEEPGLTEQAEFIAKQFLRVSHLRSGLLVEMEPGIFAFTHEGFREYLVAHALRNLLESDFIDEIFKHIDDTTWEEIILLAGAYPAMADKLRVKLIDECLNRAHACRVNQNTVGWARRMIMAGRMAYDMGDHLAPRYRDRLKGVLWQAATDPNNGLKDRIDLALTLDNLGWLTETQSVCVEFEGEGGQRFYIGKNLVTNQQYQRFWTTTSITGNGGKTRTVSTATGNSTRRPTSPSGGVFQTQETNVCQNLGGTRNSGWLIAACPSSGSHGSKRMPIAAGWLTTGTSSTRQRLTLGFTPRPSACPPNKSGVGPCMSPNQAATIHGRNPTHQRSRIRRPTTCHGTQT